MRKVFAVVAVVVAGFVSSSALGQELSAQAALDRGDLDGAREILSAQVMQGQAGDVVVAALVGEVQIALAELRLERAGVLLAQIGEKLSDVSSIEHGRKSGWFVVLAYLRAELAQAEGHSVDAKSAIREAVSLIQSGAKVHLGWRGSVEYLAASIFRDENAYARRHAEAAVSVFAETKQPYERGYALMRLGDLEWDRGKLRRAYLEYDNALRAFRDADSRGSIVLAHLHVAERLMASGETEAAKSRLSIAQREYAAAGSPPELAFRLQEIEEKLK